MSPKSSNTTKNAVVQKFWETIPPIWYRIGSQVDKTARENYEITGGHFHILRRINNGDTSVSDLADSRHISRPVVSRKVDSLVEKGLVSRCESSEDRRFTVLALTPEGERILKEIRTSTRGWFKAQLGELDDQELETVLEAFSILNKIST